MTGEEDCNNFSQAQRDYINAFLSMHGYDDGYPGLLAEAKASPFENDDRGVSDKPEIADDSKVEGNKLPATATHMFNVLAIGVGLLILGTILVAAYRRKREA